MHKYHRRGTGILPFELHLYLLFPPKLEFPDCICQNWLRTAPSQYLADKSDETENQHVNWQQYKIVLGEMAHVFPPAAPPSLVSLLLRMMNVLQILFHLVSRCKTITWLTLVREHWVFYKCAPLLTINNDSCVDGLDRRPALHMAGVLALVYIPHSVDNEDAVKDVGLWILLIDALRYRTSFPCL